MSGLTGRENFGHSLFIGAGAYTAGFLNVNFGVNPWWSLLAAPFVAVAFSLAVGFPTLRLRGPYFALAMLSGAAVMQNLTIIFSNYTGGQDGLNGLDPILDSTLAYYYLTLVLSGATTIVLKLIASSSWGTILRAIRGDEASCQAAGINVTFYKIASLMISAACAGLGGALYAHYQLQVGPGSVRGHAVDQYHHHGLCRRHRHDLRTRRRRYPAQCLDRELAGFQRISALGLHAAARVHSVFHAAGTDRPGVAAHAADAAMTALLQVERLNKRFGGLHAVKDVSFALEAVRSQACLGQTVPARPRCSTFSPGSFRSDTGIGRISTAVRSRGLSPYQIVNRGLARTFQLARPFLGMTVLENVEVACLAPRVRHAGHPRMRAQAWLDQVGLGR